MSDPFPQKELDTSLLLPESGFPPTLRPSPNGPKTEEPPWGSCYPGGTSHYGPPNEQNGFRCSSRTLDPVHLSVTRGGGLSKVRSPEAKKEGVLLCPLLKGVPDRHPRLVRTLPLDVLTLRCRTWGLSPEDLYGGVRGCVNVVDIWVQDLCQSHCADGWVSGTRH